MSGDTRDRNSAILALNDMVLVDPAALHGRRYSIAKYGLVKSSPADFDTSRGSAHVNLTLIGFEGDQLLIFAGRLVSLHVERISENVFLRNVFVNFDRYTWSEFANITLDNDEIRLLDREFVEIKSNIAIAKYIQRILNTDYSNLLQAQDLVGQTLGLKGHL